MAISSWVIEIAEGTAFLALEAPGAPGFETEGGVVFFEAILEASGALVSFLGAVFSVRVTAFGMVESAFFGAADLLKGAFALLTMALAVVEDLAALDVFDGLAALADGLSLVPEVDSGSSDME